MKSSQIKGMINHSFETTFEKEARGDTSFSKVNLGASNASLCLPLSHIHSLSHSLAHSLSLPLSLSLSLLLLSCVVAASGMLWCTAKLQLSGQKLRSRQKVKHRLRRTGLLGHCTPAVATELAYESVLFWCRYAGTFDGKDWMDGLLIHGPISRFCS